MLQLLDAARILWPSPIGPNRSSRAKACRQSRCEREDDVGTHQQATVDEAEYMAWRNCCVRDTSTFFRIAYMHTTERWIWNPLRGRDEYHWICPGYLLEGYRCSCELMIVILTFKYIPILSSF